MLAVVSILAGAPISGFAQDVAGGTGDDPVIIYDTPIDQRRAELRRALISDDDRYGNRYERRRLSEAEREALNRELRAAMRGVYDTERRSNDAAAR